MKQVGNPLTGIACSKHHANYCDTCFENEQHGYYHLEAHAGNIGKYTCQENVCKCDGYADGGIAVENLRCTEHRGNQCAFCYDSLYEPRAIGLVNNKDIPCQRIQCTCPRGTPVPNGSCTDLDRIRCLSCDIGYVLENEICVPGCICENGIPTTGDACPVPEYRQQGDLYIYSRCQACDIGYYLENFECKPNQCYCLANGLGFQTSDKKLCRHHKDRSMPSCVECNNFYHLEPMAVDSSRLECVPNKCRCDEGIVVPDQRCRIHRETQCDSCHDIGFKLDINDRCIPKTCQCANGIGVHDGTCFDEVMNICLSCDAGYKYVLREQEYYKLKYIVDDANLPFTVFNDPNINEKQKYWGGVCEELICEENEEVDGNECVPKVYNAACVCDFGKPAEGQQCLNLSSNSLDNHFCASCDSGFHLHDHKCECNVCTCDNGHPLADGTCFDESDHRCVECFDGFQLTRIYDSDEHCYEEVCTKINQCFCPYGKAAEGENCLIDGAEACENCLSEGYLLTDDGRCSPRSCPCDNGWGINDGTCMRDDRQMCDACYDGFELEIVTHGRDYFERVCVWSVHG